MQKLEILVHPQTSRFEVEQMLRAWAEQQDADVRPMGRLARRYKTEGENLHRHITGHQKRMGTVEVTYLPSTGSLTVLVHDNRRGLWAGVAYKNLGRKIREQAGI